MNPLNGPVTLRDAAARQLRQEIICGDLRPGEVIKDAELASRLGLSITPVREALALLATEQLIEMPPNRSKRVAPLTKQAAIELSVVLRLLALSAYEWGVPRLTPDHLQQMWAASRTFNAALRNEDNQGAFRAICAFHDVVIAAANNRELQRMIGTILSRFERFLLLWFNRGFWILGEETHAAILTALEQGNEEGAVAAYRNAFDRFQREIMLLPDTP